MMNKRGITIIELLASIFLIAIVSLLLFRVCFNLLEINNDNSYASKDEISRTTIIKNIESDFLENKFIGLNIQKGEKQTKIEVEYDTGKENIIISKDKLTYKDTYILETKGASYDLDPIINYVDLDNDYYLITIKIKVLMNNKNDTEKDDIDITYIGLKEDNDYFKR